MATPVSFPSTTTTFKLPLLFAGQAQKEFVVNQSMSLIDALLQNSVINSSAAPPANPAEGDTFRVTENASDDWSGHDDAIAIWIGGAWSFCAPFSGMIVFDRNESRYLHYSDGWQTAAEPIAPAGGTTVDQEARQAIIDLIEALRNIGIFSPNT